MNDELMFDKFVPAKGEVVEVLPMFPDTDVKASMIVEVAYADKVDKEGMLCIPRFLSSDNEAVKEVYTSHHVGCSGVRHRNH